MKEIEIDTFEIEDYFLEQLTIKGYIPTDEELIELANICFDFLIEKGIIEEVDE